MRVAVAAMIAPLAGCAAAVPVAVPDRAPVAVPTAAPTRPGLPMLTGVPTQGGLVRGQAAAGVTGLTLDGVAVPLAPDGGFLIGFDRDAGAAATLVQTYRGGSDTVSLAVQPRAWAIERVDAPYRAGRTDADFAAARPAELAAIAAARLRVTDAQGWRQLLAWPATGRLSGRFGAQRVYQGQPGGYHSGDDVAVPAGTPVTAPADGVVILAADHPFTLEGNLLMIDHGMGLNSALLHLSRIAVTVGETVRRGEVVGASGSTGRVTGPHLHWSLRWQVAKLDPSLVAGPIAGR